MVLGYLPLVVAGAGGVRGGGSPGCAVTAARRWAIALRVSGICPAAAGPRADSMAAAMVRTAAPSMARVTHRYQEVPAAHLVLIQAGQALAGLEVLLDRPAKPGDLDQGGQRDPLRGVAVVEGQFPGASVPAD